MNTVFILKKCGCNMPVYRVSGIYKKLITTPALIIVLNKRTGNVETVKVSQNESKYNYLLKKNEEFYTLTLIK